MQAAIEKAMHVLEIMETKLVSELPMQVDFDKLERLPAIKDTNQIAALQILSTILVPTYITKPDLYPKVIFTMAHISMTYGNSSLSACAYAYTATLYQSLGNIDLGYQYMILALKILDKFNDNSYNAKIYTVNNISVRHWKEHGITAVNYLKETINIGFQVGDIESACIASYTGRKLVCYTVI